MIESAIAIGLIAFSYAGVVVLVLRLFVVTDMDDGDE